MKPINPMSDDLLAVEYVLGVLDKEGDALAERHIVSQQNRREETANWALLMAGLRVQQNASRQPPAWLWTSIQNRMPQKTRPTPRGLYAMAASVAAIVLSALLWWALPSSTPVFLAEQRAQLAPSVPGNPVWQIEAPSDLSEVTMTLGLAEQL